MIQQHRVSPWLLSLFYSYCSTFQRSRDGRIWGLTVRGTDNLHLHFWPNKSPISGFNHIHTTNNSNDHSGVCVQTRHAVTNMLKCSFSLQILCRGYNPENASYLMASIPLSCYVCKWFVCFCVFLVYTSTFLYAWQPQTLNENACFQLWGNILAGDTRSPEVRIQWENITDQTRFCGTISYAIMTV